MSQTSFDPVKVGVIGLGRFGRLHSLTLTGLAEAELVAYKGATGKESALHDTIFSTVPGAPAFVGKATKYRANVPALNINIDIKDHNAISSLFRFEH